MGDGTAAHPTTPALRAYLLGAMSFDSAEALQRRLMYEVAGEPDAAAVLILEHPPGISIGREGSRQHLRLPDEELTHREWPVRWVGRGGGVMLHLPGQVACYPILSLDRLGLTLADYLHTLHAVAQNVLADFGVASTTMPDRPGVFVQNRRLVHVGAAVRNNVTGYGLVVNVNPDLQPFHNVRCDGDSAPMTSLQREAAVRVRLEGVRQRLIDRVAESFGFARVSLFHHDPVVVPAAGFHAVPHRT